jgi:carbon-monoxide dehydrogenase large subunit
VATWALCVAGIAAAKLVSLVEPSGLLAGNLAGVAAFLFIALPERKIHGRGERWRDYGLPWWGVGDARTWRAWARGLAAAALECDPDDVVVADSRAHVKGAPHRALGLAQLAALAERPDAGRTLGEPGLSATRYHSPERVTWAAGVHVAAVEVDRETGAVSVLAYHAVHDAGHEINPLIVEGQTQGGAVQGIGAALGEEIVYDASGQVLTGTLMEYALPRADSVPPIDVGGCDSPSPLNPLGAKGTGEGSAVPGPAAIANAVADALDGVEIVQTPLRPALLVRA